jgi:hypothetical protein
MHEYLVAGFYATAAPHEIALAAEKAQLLFVDARVMMQD